MKCRALSDAGHIIWFGKDLTKKSYSTYCKTSSGTVERFGWRLNDGDIVNIGGEDYVVSIEDGAVNGTLKKIIGSIINVGGQKYRIVGTNTAYDSNGNNIGTATELLAMYTLEQRMPFGDTAEYFGSTIDTYLESEEFYYSLPETLQNAMRHKEVVPWKCAISTSRVNDDSMPAVATFERGGEEDYYLTLVDPGEAQLRLIYLPSVFDVFKYFNVLRTATFDNTPLRSENFQTMFGELNDSGTWFMNISSEMNNLPLVLTRERFEEAPDLQKTLPVQPMMQVLLNELEYTFESGEDGGDVDGVVTRTYPALDNYSSDSQAVADSLMQRLSVIKGELWYQVNYGLPIMEKQRGTNVLDLVIGDIISSHPGVASLDSYTSKVNGHTYSYECKITTVFSDSLTISNNLSI